MQASFTGNLLVASSTATHPLYAGGVCLIVHQDEDQTIGVMLNRPMQPMPEAVEMLLGGEDLEEDEGGDLQASDIIGAANEDWEDTDSQNFSDELTHHDFGIDLEPSGTVDGEDPAWEPNRPINRLNDLSGSQATGNSAESMAQGNFGLPLQNLHFGGPMSGPVVALHRSAQHAEMEPGLGIYVAAQRDHLEQLIREHDESFRLIVGHLRWTDDELKREMDQGIWHLLPATVDNAFLPAFGMWPRLVRRATTRSLAGWIGTPGRGTGRRAKLEGNAVCQSRLSLRESSVSRRCFRGAKGDYLTAKVSLASRSFHLPSELGNSVGPLAPLLA